MLTLDFGGSAKGLGSSRTSALGPRDGLLQSVWISGSGLIQLSGIVRSSFNPLPQRKQRLLKPIQADGRARYSVQMRPSTKRGKLEAVGFVTPFSRSLWRTWVQNHQHPKRFQPPRAFPRTAPVRSGDRHTGKATQEK